LGQRLRKGIDGEIVVSVKRTEVGTNGILVLQKAAMKDTPVPVMLVCVDELGLSFAIEAYNCAAPHDLIYEILKGAQRFGVM